MQQLVCSIIFFLFPLFSFSAVKQPIATNGNYQAIRPVRPLIILDAGHGGLDKGARIRYPYCEEKKMTLTTTLLTKKYLEKLGYIVSLTRSRDFFVPIKRRILVANKTRSEVFVSIHFNSAPSRVARGIEVFYCEGQKQKSIASKKLATEILKRSIFCTKTYSRGVKRAKFSVIRETRMPACLIEGGFLTNPREREFLRQPQYLEKLAKGIAEGIDRYCKLQKK